MILTKENTLHLYHYCVEIADALRPFLNIHNYNDADPSFWIPKLTQFEKIISDILQLSEKPSDEVEFLKSDYNPNFIREAHLRIFTNIISGEIFGLDDAAEHFQAANELTKQALKILYGVEL